MAVHSNLQLAHYGPMINCSKTLAFLGGPWGPGGVLLLVGQLVICAWREAASGGQTHFSTNVCPRDGGGAWAVMKTGVAGRDHPLVDCVGAWNAPGFLEVGTIVSEKRLVPTDFRAHRRHYRKLLF